MLYRSDRRTPDLQAKIVSDQEVNGLGNLCGLCAASYLVFFKPISEVMVSKFSTVLKGDPELINGPH